MFLNIVTDSSLSCPQSLGLPSSWMIKSKCLSLGSPGPLLVYNLPKFWCPRNAKICICPWGSYFVEVFILLNSPYGIWWYSLLDLLPTWLGRRSTGFSGNWAYKESACNTENPGSIPGLGRPPGGNPLQCFCLEHPHCQRSVVGYSPCGCKESDVTEWLNTHRLLQDRGRQMPQLWRHWDSAQHTLFFLL